MVPRIAIPLPTSFDPAYNRLNSPSYSEAIRASGGEPVEVALNLTYSQLVKIVESCDGILLPGSPADVDPARYGQTAEESTAPADPRREFIDETLLNSGLHLRRPILGICFGTQMINVLHGGTLIQDLTVMPVNHAAGRAVAVAHTASVACDSRLATMLDHEDAPDKDGFMRLPVNSSHHQAVAIPGSGLRIAARCAQDGVVEAIESTSADRFLVGVQWHPERTCATSASSRSLFSRFLAEAAASHASASRLKAFAT